MAPFEVILVDGLPGAGKSTLARRIADEFEAVLVSRDAVKEALYDNGHFDSGPSTLSQVALEVVLWLTATTDRLSVVDCAIPQSDLGRWRDVLTPKRDRVLEVFCSCPFELAMARYAQRSRTGRHPAHTLESIDPSLLALFNEPVNVGEVVEVDTTDDFDCRHLPLSPPGSGNLRT